MMPKLRNEDRLAVDLLLDRAVASSGGNGQTGFTQVNGAVPEQLGHVQAVLRVLDMMPADEPPADLMTRTLRLVEAETTHHDPAALRPAQPMVPQMQMPHA